MRRQDQQEQIPRGWHRKKLGDVCSLITRGIAPKYLDECGVRVVNQKCVRGHRIDFSLARRNDPVVKRVPQERLILLGDVLVNSTGTGTLGRVAQVRSKPKEPTTVDTHVTIVRPKEALFYPDFFGYALVAIESLLIAGGQGAVGQTELPRSDIAEKFEIVFPESLDEQKRIVAVLDQAFAALDRARAHAEANLADAIELFQVELRSLFAFGMDGWTRDQIQNICTIRSGHTLPKRLEYADAELPYVKVADMNLEENEDGILTSSRFARRNEIVSSQVFPVGTTIFPKRGGSILTNKKRMVLNEICADLNIMGVIPGDTISSRFLYFFFLSVDMRKVGSGSAIPQINNYDIAPMKISYPKSLDEQRVVTERLLELRSKTDTIARFYRQRLADLATLRQSLLQKAFSGELT